MNSPSIYKADAIKKWNCQINIANYRYLARPVGFQGINLKHRIKCAWMVFTGKADVLKWEGQ